MEARPNVNGNAVELTDLDRPRMHYTRTNRGQLQHLVVLDVSEFASGLHETWICSEDSVDVGVDLTRLGIQRGGQRNGGRGRTSASKRCHLEDFRGSPATRNHQ